MKTAAIIQSRMGSTRLPGKSLMALAGRPVIGWVVERARLIAGVDVVMVATTDVPADDQLACWCAMAGVPVFRGSSDDVLSRYIGAARSCGADVVIRITGDCPLIDPIESAKVLELFRRTPGCEYASNVETPSLPDGLDTEVVRLDVLEKIAAQTSFRPDREHVTHFIHRNLGLFRTAQVINPVDLSRHRWTLDEPQDYEFLSRVTEELAERGQFGHLGEVLALLRAKSDLMRINADIERNEGLMNSLQKEAAGNGRGSQS